MRRQIALWLAVVLMLALALPGTAQPAGRFQALYWPSFQEDIYALAPGGGFGDYLALAAQGSLLAFIRRNQASKPAAALTLYDLSSARALHSLPLAATGWGDSWQLGFWGRGSLYTLHEDGLTLTLYDQALAETLRFTPPPGFDAACPDPAGQALWCAAYGRMALTRFSLPGGEAVEIPVDLPTGWYFSDFVGTKPDGGVLSVFSNDAGLNIFVSADATGSVRLLPVMAGFTWFTGGLAYAARAGDAMLMPVPGEGRVLRLSAWREAEYPALLAGSLLLTEAFGAGPALRLFDLDRGQIIAELEAPAGDTPLIFDLIAASSLGYAVMADNQYELDRYDLYLWDFRQSPLALPAGARELTIAQLRAENDALAQEIAGKHGISLHIRQAGVRFTDEVYYAQPLDQEPALARALSDLDRTLNQLPPGMLREAYTADHDSLGFYLTGGIRARGQEGLRAPTGFAAGEGTERFIALDASSPDGSRSSTLSHELMHLLEDRLAQPDTPGGRSLLDDWLLLCPPDAPDRGFFYDYHDEEGWEISDTSLTADDPEAWEHPENIWFIDAYSRSFPIEDRARLFESLFAAGDSPPEFLKSPRLLRKAQYLAASLREAFTSLKEAPQLPWERHLSPIPYETFRQEFEALDAAARP